MSKEMISVNFHYGTEDFKKIFMRIAIAKLQDQKLLSKNAKEQCDNKDITQLPFTHGK